MPVVNTRRLFAKLLRPLRIDFAADVGSMDGRDALSIRERLPDAEVLAFEANPENVARMQGHPLLAARGIRVAPLAVTDFDGEAAFFVVKVTDPAGPAQGVRGMSSLHERPREAALSALQRVLVKTTRLDTFVAALPERRARRMALWIDAEGKSFEVVAGASGLWDQIHLLHLEVETIPCIASAQKLYRDIVGQLADAGFVELATDAPSTRVQFNVLFVRADLSGLARLRVWALLVVARLRLLLTSTARKLVRAAALGPSGTR